MRIAYVYIGAGVKSDSVSRKVVNQMNSLANLGNLVKGIFFSNFKKDDSSQIENTDYVFVNPPTKGLFIALRNRICLNNALYKWAKENSSEFDIIYVRYFRPTLSGLLFFIKYRKKIITEHQTNEEKELQNLWNENAFGFRPSLFLSWLEHNFIPLLHEKIYSSIAIGCIRKIVTVTDEIGIYERRRAFPAKPKVFVVGNGVNAHEYGVSSFTNVSGNVIKLAMLVGGSTNTDWHGVDFVIEGLDNYRGKFDFRLILVGKTEFLEKYKHPKVHLVGELFGNELDELMMSINLSVGSFALERKGISQGSTLKVREYLSRGIPVIYGHLDNDLLEFEREGYVLRLPSMQAVDFAKVERFIDSFNHINSSELNNKIKKITLIKLDYSVKAKRLIEVFNE
jgi:hypothetical protein